jgi:tRNA (cmo5U34)-methyltransferase
MSVRDTVRTVTEPHSASQAFDAHATEYDALRRRLVPPFEELYGTAIEALELLSEPPRRVLDLGAGTGMMSHFVRAAHPSCELVLLDSAARMLEQARAALDGPVVFEPGDLREQLPSGPFDAVVSALAIHHLSDTEKRDLFARVHAELRAGGVFVNAEHVAAPDPRLEAHYEDWHKRMSLQLGTDAEEWTAALGRMSHDRRADTVTQLGWLAEAGFVEVDCLFKCYGFAVLFARRAER